MSFTVLKPGLQATLQGRPRIGYRHMGVPWAGAADPLSLALANRLVGNRPDITALELTLGGLSVRFQRDIAFALTGAPCRATLADAEIEFHTTQLARAGDVLALGVPAVGMRTYLAVAGGICADTVLGSPSTYLPAGLGGFHGRALQANDEIGFATPSGTVDPAQTPPALRPPITAAFALRAHDGPEAGFLSRPSHARLFGAAFTAAAQIDRMGIRLEGAPLTTTSDGKMASAPVFPGCIQCPENGEPIILLADAQTTGGYPRIAQLCRADLHLLGQVRPRAHVRLIARSLDQARLDYRAKASLFADWLPGFRL